MVVQEAGHRNALAPPTVQRAQIGCSSVEIAESLHRTSEPPAQVITHFMQGLCKPEPALAEPGRARLGWASQLALRSECRHRCDLDLDLGLCLFTLHSSYPYSIFNPVLIFVL
jgi:hypothetical protein